MKQSGVYLITNHITNKVYVGSSNNLGRRKIDHFSRLKMQNHANIHLQYSYNRYGRGAFSWEILEYCTEEELLNVEQYYIDLYESCNMNKGYNITPKADRTAISEETRKKMIENKKNNYSENLKIKLRLKATLKIMKQFKGSQVSEKTRKRLSESHMGHPAWNKGKKMSKECIEKLIQSRKGKPSWSKGKKFSKEYREKLSLAHKGKSHPNKGRRTFTGLINHMVRLANNILGKVVKSRKGMPGNRKGCKLSEETRKKISMAGIGRPSPMKGRKVSDETKLKQSMVRKGKKFPNRKRIKFSENHKTNISSSLNRRYSKIKAKNIMDKVCFINLCMA